MPSKPCRQHFRWSFNESGVKTGIATVDNPTHLKNLAAKILGDIYLVPSEAKDIQVDPFGIKGQSLNLDLTIRAVLLSAASPYAIASLIVGYCGALQSDGSAFGTPAGVLYGGAGFARKRQTNAEAGGDGLRQTGAKPAVGMDLNVPLATGPAVPEDISARGAGIGVEVAMNVDVRMEAI
ncbi:hypothetical protein HDU86_006493 [Geranomyces michiganensis]|nr:hypothetical protein HDU86_006493 [Geranomyces michiganensis]